MPQTCSLCKHRRRDAIEKELLAQVPLRHVAAHFDTSTGALQRHRPHISAGLVRAQDHLEVLQAASVLDDLMVARERFEFLYETAVDLLKRARDEKDLRSANAAVGRAVDILTGAYKYLELRGELTGELRRIEQGPLSLTIVLTRPESLIPTGPVIDVDAEPAE